MSDTAPLAAPGAPHPAVQPLAEIRGSVRWFVGLNLFGAVAGGVLAAGLVYLRPGIGAETFPLLYGGLLLYLAADTAYWLRRGVHRALLDGEALHVWRGRALRHERIPVGEITDVHLHRRFTRRSLQILLGKEVVRVPGATFYPGPKVWITNDAFDHAAFDRFAEAALRYAKEGR